MSDEPRIPIGYRRWYGNGGSDYTEYMVSEYGPRLHLTLGNNPEAYSAAVHPRYARCPSVAAAVRRAVRRSQ